MRHKAICTRKSQASVKNRMEKQTLTKTLQVAQTLRRRHAA